LEDLYEIRKLLEPMATARAAKYAGRDSILKAVGLLAAMERETDGRRWTEYNDSFHSVIEEAGFSPRLVAILKNLRDLSALYVTHAIVAEPAAGSAGSRVLAVLAGRRGEQALQQAHLGRVQLRGHRPAAGVVLGQGEAPARGAQLLAKPRVLGGERAVHGPDAGQFPLESRHGLLEHGVARAGRRELRGGGGEPPHHLHQQPPGQLV